MYDLRPAAEPAHDAPSVLDPVTEQERRVAAALRSRRRAKVRRLSPTLLSVAIAFARAPELSVADVARMRHVSPNTIKTQLRGVFWTLDVHRRVELHAWLDDLTSDEERRRMEAEARR